MAPNTLFFALSEIRESRIPCKMQHAGPGSKRRSQGNTQANYAHATAQDVSLCLPFSSRTTRSIDKSESEDCRVICAPIQQTTSAAQSPTAAANISADWASLLPNLRTLYDACRFEGLAKAKPHLTDLLDRMHEPGEILQALKGDEWPRRLGTTLKSADSQNFAELPCADSRARASGRRSQGTAQS